MPSTDVYLESFEFCTVCGKEADIVARFNQFKYYPGYPDRTPKENALINVCESCAQKMVAMLERGE